MTDLHTHILPGVDDGAKTVSQSLDMLRAEWGQGVDTVVLTPHFYREYEEPERFLRRREKASCELEEAVSALPKEEQAKLPRRILGVEVAWRPNLADWEELPRMGIGETGYLLLELPFTPWTDRLFDQIYTMMGRTGITPVIAHLERYLDIQKREHIDELLAMDVPIQFGSDTMARWFPRRRIAKLMERCRRSILASDCHGLDHRAPDLGHGMEIIRKKFGEDSYRKLVRQADELAGAGRE